VSVALVSARAVRRGTLGDRAVAMDMLTSVVSCALLVASTFTEDSVFLDMALVLGMLGFLATVAVGRFIEQRGL
ncbi:MAG: hypothetical protein RLY50_689, partial [Actinomycetota bacterium]